MSYRAATVLLIWAIGGFAIGLAAAAGAPVLFGMKSFAVLSGSMEPVLSTGDIVVEEPVRANAVRVGDIVTFNDPDHQGRRITHRVRSAHVERGRARFVTKGDANDSTESWETDATGQVGRVTYRIPLIGYGIARLNGPAAKVFLVMIPALLLAMLELVRIWRPKPREPEAADATA